MQRNFDFDLSLTEWSRYLIAVQKFVNPRWVRAVAFTIFVIFVAILAFTGTLITTRFLPADHIFLTISPLIYTGIGVFLMYKFAVPKVGAWMLKNSRVSYKQNMSVQVEFNADGIKFSEPNRFTHLNWAAISYVGYAKNAKAVILFSSPMAYFLPDHLFETDVDRTQFIADCNAKLLKDT